MAEPTNITTKPSRKHTGDVLRGWSRDDKIAYIGALKLKLQGANGKRWLDHLNSAGIKGSELYADYTKYALEDPNVTYAQAHGEGHPTDAPDTTGLLSSDPAEQKAPISRPTPTAGRSTGTIRREQYRRPDRRQKQPKTAPLLYDEVERLKDDLRGTEGYYEHWLRNFDGKPELTELYTRTYREPVADVELRKRLRDLDRSLRGAGAKAALQSVKTGADRDVVLAEYEATYGKTAKEAARGGGAKPTSPQDVQKALARSIKLDDVPDRFSPAQMREIWKDEVKRRSFFGTLRRIRVDHPDIANQFLELNAGKGGVKEYFKMSLKRRRAHSNAAGDSKPYRLFPNIPKKDPKAWEEFLTTGKWVSPDAMLRQVPLNSAVYRVASAHKIDPNTLYYLYDEHAVARVLQRIGRTDLRRACIATVKTLSDREIVEVAAGDADHNKRFRHHLSYYTVDLPNAAEKLKLLRKKYPRDAAQFQEVH